MNLNWLGLLWKKKDKEMKEYDPLASYYGGKTIDELVKMYDTEETWLKFLANDKGGKLEEEDYKRLKRIEDEIIRKTPDEFEKKILRLFADRRYNIVELMNKRWDEDTKDVCRKICHYLRYGNIYPSTNSLFNPLPFPGHELFSWLLSKTGNDKSDRLHDMFSCATEMFKQKRILGHDFSNEEVKKHQFLPPTIDSLGGRILIVFTGEFARQVSIIIEIWKMEGEEGRKYLEEILKDMP